MGMSHVGGEVQIDRKERKMRNIQHGSQVGPQRLLFKADTNIPDPKNSCPTDFVKNLLDLSTGMCSVYLRVGV